VAVQQFGIMDQADEDICQVEIEQYNNSMSNKTEIILSAATKLEKSEKYKKPDIANRIVKLFPEWKRSTIYNALDETFKREYNDSSDDDAQHQTTLLEEIFYHLIDTSENLKKIAKTIIKRSTESVELAKTLDEELTQAIHSLHDDDYFNEIKSELSNIRQIQNLVEFAKKMAFDTQLIADKIDSRQKIDMAMKLGLKLKLTLSLPRTLAKKLAISPKWISQIDNDSTILNFIENVPCCPKCLFNFRDYINECDAAEKAGLPKPEIK